jgi:CheY-like chemotaxis protein
MNQIQHTILVVEDEVLVREWVADEFRALGFHVLEAGDATEALLVLTERRPIDVLLTDIRMPGKMDGVALAKTVHAIRPT